MSNLRLLNETTVSSSVASVNITDVFTTDFDIYKIVLSDTVSDTNTVDLNLKFIDSSGIVVISSDYEYAWLRVRADSDFNQVRSEGDSDIQVGFGQVNTALSNGVVGYVFNPFSSNDYKYNRCNLVIDAENKIYAINPLNNKKEEIKDNTIVEFGYDDSRETNFKWIPHKVRHDKTQSYRQGEKVSRNGGPAW